MRTEIRNAINAGQEVTVHESPINAFGWSGSGYIITDPETGSGAYKISGGANGGFFLAFLLTALSLIILTFAVLTAGLTFGGILLASALVFEWILALQWAESIRNAESPEEFNKANFAQSIVAILGILAGWAAKARAAEAALTFWFGYFFALILSQIGA